MKTKICEFCRKSFSKKDVYNDFGWAKVRFCSVKCGAENRSLLTKDLFRYKKCIFCKKVFSNKRSDGKKMGKTQWGKIKYCSWICSGKNKRSPFNECSIIDGVVHLKWRDKTVLVDEVDLEKIKQFGWFVTSHGYAVNSISRKYLHHFIVPKKKKMDVDHINRNRLDNRRENLRLVTHRENLLNSARFEQLLLKKATS